MTREAEFHATGPMIDLRYVKKLIDMIDESSVDSIEISSEKGIKIRIAKSPVTRGGVSVAAPMSIPTVMPQAMIANSCIAIEVGELRQKHADRAAGPHSKYREVWPSMFWRQRTVLLNELFKFPSPLAIAAANPS